MSDFFTSTSSSMAIDPDKLAAIRDRFLADWDTLQKRAGQGSLQAVSDRRFSDPAWSSSPAYLTIAHVYLLWTRAFNDLVDAVQIDDQARERLRFTVMQWIEATSPSNFFLTNPQAQQKALDTQGQSISQGMQLLLNDLSKGRLTQTDESAFQVGVNVATTPGQVIYENTVMQVIQYAPQTGTVHQTPLLIVPPCINKYYILDLQENNSFVRYAIQQGFTVFLISWRNPLPLDTDAIQQATWGDYLQHGVLAALHVARQVTGQDQVNALGFCVGGTMLASALALAQAQGQNPVSSLTLLTSLLDFTHAGVLGVFVDEQHARMRDVQFGAGGLMPAHELATTFSFLRPGELVWNYVNSSYLMGSPPSAFDLLYWNSDGTNLPGPLFAWYFRNMYLENNLPRSKALSIDGRSLDVSALTMPAYIYGSRDDHIVPWQGAYDSMHLLTGPRRFVLGASGHIAGVINHPSRNRRSYWAHDADLAESKQATGAALWLSTSTEHSGSWWPDWIQWLAQQSGQRVTAPQQLGSNTFSPIEPAPGRYVKVRAV